MFAANPHPLNADRPTTPEGHLLLIIEDERSLLRAFAHAFERLGYTVLTAADVPSALEHWRAHGDEISMLISDVQMPGPPVEQLIREVRLSETRVPILLMSGELRGSEERIRDLMQSVDGFLSKPLRIDALRVEVERQLRTLPPR